MENPVQVVRSNITVGKVLAWFVTGVAVMLILDVSGLTPWLLQPFTTAKAKFGRAS